MPLLNSSGILACTIAIVLTMILHAAAPNGPVAVEVVEMLRKGSEAVSYLSFDDTEPDTPLDHASLAAPLPSSSPPVPPFAADDAGIDATAGEAIRSQGYSKA